MVGSTDPISLRFVMVEHIHLIYKFLTLYRCLYFSRLILKFNDTILSTYKPKAKYSKFKGSLYCHSWLGYLAWSKNG